MRKILAAFCAVALMSTLLLGFSVTAFAATPKAVEYYDEQGNQITIQGVYYNSQGQPMFNSSCYYLDTEGNPVYVGGCRIYYYNADGELVAGNYYYDTNGKAVTRPASYPGGWGCGSYYYNTQGNVVNGTTYYDDFGNPVDPPQSTQPTYPRSGGRGYGCGCGWCW